MAIAPRSSTTQKDKFQQWEPGTGAWLLGSPEFRDWRNETGKMLWCSGMCKAFKKLTTEAIKFC